MSCTTTNHRVNHNNHGICLNYGSTNGDRADGPAQLSGDTHTPSDTVGEQVEERCWTGRQWADCTCLKAHKEPMETIVLQNSVAKSIQSFEVDHTFFDKTLRALVDRDYVCFQTMNNLCNMCRDSLGVNCGCIITYNYICIVFVMER